MEGDGVEGSVGSVCRVEMMQALEDMKTEERFQLMVYH